MAKDKMSDIFREKVVSRKERNSFGEWQVAEKIFGEKRPVVRLSWHLRVVNYFIDLLVIILLAIPGDYFFFSHSSTINILIFLIYLVYYVFLEFYFQQTIGKYLTGFWHDTWTRTFVISINELSMIKCIQSGEEPEKSDSEQWDEWHSWQQK